MKTNVTKSIPIIGMHCASCKSLIEQALAQCKGVQKAKVNFAAEQLYVKYDPALVRLDDIAKVVAQAGPYSLVSISEGEAVLASPPEVEKLSLEDKAGKQRAVEFRKLQRRVVVTGLLSIPFWIHMLWMLLSRIGLIPHFDEVVSLDPFLFNVLQLVISSVILIIGSPDLVKSAFVALKKRSANMDTLVVIGVFSAWVYSAGITLFTGLLDNVSAMSPVYFEAAVFILFFILLGRLLETKAKGRAREAIMALLKLQPSEATVIQGGNHIRKSVSEILVGDNVFIKPGEKIPVDGEVIEGESAIDESMITGESIPSDKTIGSSVIGGTINKNGVLVIQAKKVGNQTMLSRIIQLVENAQASQAPIEKIADKVSSVFVPVVLGIAVFTFLFWLVFAAPLGVLPSDENPLAFALYTSITVLIIACPCALGLATPTAIMVSSGTAASKGILARDAEALQTLSKVNVIVFDKTGTLTEGKPKVVNTVFVSNDPEEIRKISRILYEIESYSEHPVSKAILEYFGSQFSTVSQGMVHSFKTIGGKGITAMYGNIDTVIGTRNLLEEKKVGNSSVLNRFEQVSNKKGETVFWVAMQGKPVAAVSVADSLRADAKDMVKELRNIGIKTAVLSGDRKAAVETLAKELGIHEVYAEVLPEDKQRIIQELMNKGNIVAMVGDGINDAPALAQASVGIAMGTGTDVAMESGDVVLVKGSLAKVTEAIKLSKQTMRVIVQNLVWAFGYNVLAIPLAGGVLYPLFSILLSPVVASAAMALSSFSVVMNSLRLRRW